MKKRNKKEVSAAAAMLGRLGGRVSTPAKAAAARLNATRPRPNRRKKKEQDNA
jgi:hypothetical protein